MEMTIPTVLARKTPNYIVMDSNMGPAIQEGDTWVRTIPGNVAELKLSQVSKKLFKKKEHTTTSTKAPA